MLIELSSSIHGLTLIVTLIRPRIFTVDARHNIIFLFRILYHIVTNTTHLFHSYSRYHSSDVIFCNDYDEISKSYFFVYSRTAGLTYLNDWTCVSRINAAYPPTKNSFGVDSMSMWNCWDKIWSHYASLTWTEFHNIMYTRFTSINLYVRII